MRNRNLTPNNQYFKVGNIQSKKERAEKWEGRKSIRERKLAEKWNNKTIVDASATNASRDDGHDIERRRCRGVLGLSYSSVVVLISEEKFRNRATLWGDRGVAERQRLQYS